MKEFRDNFFIKSFCNQKNLKRYPINCLKCATIFLEAYVDEVRKKVSTGPGSPLKAAESENEGVQRGKAHYRRCSRSSSTGGRSVLYCIMYNFLKASISSKL